MNVLLVNPDTPITFWSFKHALKFVSKKAMLPPLGLLTVAGLLPEDWSKKLVDMATTKLRDRDIKWADYVFVTAMFIQKDSARRVIDRCKKLGTKVVAGGPLFTAVPEDYADVVDHLVLGEAETTLPEFLKDLRLANSDCPREIGRKTAISWGNPKSEIVNSSPPPPRRFASPNEAAGGDAGAGESPIGNRKSEIVNSSCPKRIYKSCQWADMKDTPMPLWELAKVKKYALMCLQYSRGCPYNCDFCDVTMLFGHKLRTKSKDQVLQELESLYSTGWRGQVFFVDDNFIGNKQKLKKEILPAIIGWMGEREYPFSFNTQTSIDLADDEELMKLMVEAGFDCVFVGIETPNQDSLTECNKLQNKGRDLVACVKKIQKFGMEVQGGFILGFDSDQPSAFENLIRFIQESGIVTAMVGLLNAPRGTKLYRRLMSENRLLRYATGDNTDLSINFIPKMNREDLLRGYQKVVRTIYSQKYFSERVMTFLRNYRPLDRTEVKFGYRDIKAFIKSVWRIGIISRGSIYYWKLVFWSLRRPRYFYLAVTFAICGFHFRKMFAGYQNV